ncbi:hypothetical protein [Roseinatronobacter sp. NSM]|uniref:hypothetical protein n=1 Tax=Roseinatronobacter sp. NSM TaxID=3457785 RepID=UPI0040350E74
MRHIALILAFLLTLSGLSQAHAHRVVSFSDTEAPQKALGALWLEHVGRAPAQAVSDADPAGADAASWPGGAAVAMSLASAGRLCAATGASGPVPQGANVGNPARAPPLPF